MRADFAIHETGDGGDLHLQNEDIATTGGLYNQAYLAFFGGNKEQSTSEDISAQDQRFDWWGNFYLKPENQFNSRLERTLNSVVLNSSGLSKIEDAAKEDLAYLNDYANITVSASIVGIRKCQILIIMVKPGIESVKIKFLWDGTKKTLIEEIII